MELNNKLLAIVVMVLGLFLTAVSLRLSSIIESKPECMKKASLLNSNRGVLILGLLMFSSSGAYLLCKMNCSGEVNGSSSELVYAGFNLVLGIVVIVLFSIIHSQLKSCVRSLSNIDSMLVIIGIVIGCISLLISLVVLGKKLYSNRATLKEGMGNIRQKLGGVRASSPYRDPFGFNDVEDEIDPEL